MKKIRRKKFYPTSTHVKIFRSCLARELSVFGLGLQISETLRNCYDGEERISSMFCKNNLKKNGIDVLYVNFDILIWKSIYAIKQNCKNVYLTSHYCVLKGGKEEI